VVLRKLPTSQADDRLACGSVYIALREVYDVSEDEAIERLSVAEAARTLGVTRDAIHKRISRGSIEHEKGEDGRFYVYVDTSTSELDASTDKSKDESKVEALERLLDSQQERILFLERELERRGDETERLHQIVAGLTRATAELSARLPELEAPSEPPQSPETATVDTGEAEPQPEREERGFWRRLFGG
jgi:hypothetical protein